MLPNNAEQRISQRDILRRSPVALSDIIPQQKRAHPAGGFLSYRKLISYTIKKIRKQLVFESFLYSYESYKLLTGIEPVTSALPMRRTTDCATAARNYHLL